MTSWISHGWSWLAVRSDDLHLWLYPSVYRTTIMGPIWEDIQ